MDAPNANTPPDALVTLAQDEDPSVRWSALLNSQTPARALELLARHEAETAGDRQGYFIERGHIAHHPNTPSS